MTIIPKSISVQGFLTFQERQTWILYTSGFYALTGQNLEEPQLGGNNCGKSSLLAAFVWCYYGKDTRKSKANDIINSTKNYPCEVEATFKVDDKDHILFRSQSPNKLRLDDGTGYRDVTQDEVDKLLGLNYEAFLRVVLMGQTNTFFFDLEPSEKLNIFSEILKLNYWVERSDLAKKEAKTLEENIATFKLSIATNEGRIEADEASLKDLKVKEEQFEDAINAQMKEKKGQSKALKLNIDRLAESVPDRENLEKRIVLSQKEGLQAAALRNRLAASIEHKQRTYNQDSKSGGACSKCGQNLRGTALGKYESDLEIQKESLDKLKVELVEAEKKEQFCMDRNNEYKAQTTALLRINQLEREFDTIQAEYKKLEEATNPYSAQINRLKSLLIITQTKLKGLQEDLTQAEVRLSNVKYWVDGFKQLRLWIIEGALEEFEIEVAAALEPLGLGNWEITFDVEKENKSGTVSKEFSVSVKPPGAKEALPWKTLGGGVTQRLRIAGAAAFASLISNRLGVYYSVEIWDEPTQHLSVEGVDGLLEYFANRAKETNKQLWLVDHRSHHSGLFDGGVKVIKDKTGSKLLPMEN